MKLGDALPCANMVGMKFLGQFSVSMALYMKIACRLLVLD